jgi:hypothetical protein
MNSLRCEHEPAVSRAVRTGFWPDGLRQHLSTCTACAQACTVTEALLLDSARQDGAHRRPDAPHAWLEARRRARLHLRRRALFWFRALRTLTLIYFPAVLLWSLSHRTEPAAIPWKLSLRAGFASVLSVAAVPFAVTGALLASLCIAMGSWYLLREARTPLQPNPGR